jgi:hypothetical protein
MNFAGVLFIFPVEDLCLSLFPIHLLISERPSRDTGLFSIPRIVATFCVFFQCPIPSLAPVPFSLKDVPASHCDKLFTRTFCPVR